MSNEREQQLLGRITELEAENAQLRARLAELEAEVRKGRRQATPFSKDRSCDSYERKADPQKPGRKAGQGGLTYRQPSPPEAVNRREVVPLPCCPECGGPLEEHASHEHFQIDVPSVQPVITCFVNESGYCPRCRRRYETSHPEQLSQACG